MQRTDQSPMGTPLTRPCRVPHESDRSDTPEEAEPIPLAGGPAFEKIVTFRVADSSWVSRGRWVWSSSSTFLRLELSENQNPDPLRTRGSATRKSLARKGKINSSAIKYWS